MHHFSLSRLLMYVALGVALAGCYYSTESLPTIKNRAVESDFAALAVGTWKVEAVSLKNAPVGASLTDIIEIIELTEDGQYKEKWKSEKEHRATGKYTVLEDAIFVKAVRKGKVKGKDKDARIEGSYHIREMNENEMILFLPYNQWSYAEVRMERVSKE